MIEDKNLIVVFKDGEPILTNAVFNTFFGVASFELYKSNFGSFVDNFVLHPSYFNKEKILEGKEWFDAILELDETDRIVSMMNALHEPYAFSVTVDKNKDGYLMVIFTDITQQLIKRIMIENNVSIDKLSGAYDKKYFLQVTQSFEDAAEFNEKIIGITEINLVSDDELGADELKLFVKMLKSVIRQDDMLVRFSREKFLLVYLVDDELKAKQVTKKIHEMLDKESSAKLKYTLDSISQRSKESVKVLIKKLANPSNE